MSALCRAVAIGDAHLGPNARQEQRLRSLDTIIEAGLALGPSLGCWLWPGDLFNAKSTIADRNELAQRLIRMANAAPVMGARGNHDAEGDLKIFEQLKTRFPIFFAEKPGSYLLDLPTGHRLVVFALPWPEEGGLVSAGVAPDAVALEARRALDAIFMVNGETMARARAEGHLTAFIGHCTVVGAVSSNGQPQAGLGIEIDAELLSRLGDCPHIVNHIHKGQRVGSAIYPGSICRLDWGEIEPKRFLEVAWFDHEDFVIDERPLDVAPMYHVDGWLSREGFRFDDERPVALHAVDGVLSWKGCEVRVRAKFHASEKAILELAKAQLLAQFADAEKLQLELVAVPDAGLRAPEVAAAQSLDEKVAAWATASGTVLPERALVHLRELQTTPPDVLTQNVGISMQQHLHQPDTSAGVAA